MRLATISVISIVCAAMIFTSGCVSEQQFKDLKMQNAAQEKRLKELESQMQTVTLELDQAKRELERNERQERNRNAGFEAESRGIRRR